MSIVDNQESLIEQTQDLYNHLLNTGQYSEAIAIAKVLVDLSAAYKDLGTVRPIPRPRLTAQWESDTDAPFGTPLFSEAKSKTQVDRTLREATRPRFNPDSQPQPKPQPSRYAWSDGFTGVEVPRRESDTPLPSPDYWEDARRQ